MMTTAPHVADEDCKVEEKLLIDALASLPSYVARELLSTGVCVRCVFRLLRCSSFLNLSIPDIVYDHDNNLHNESLSILGFRVAEPEICPACSGILQLKFRDGGGNVVRMRSTEELAVSVVELVKTDGHLFDRFSIELSFPHIVSENEQEIRAYMEKKYRTEPWFVSDYMSVKEAFKLMTTSSLQKISGSHYGLGCLCIRFNYTLGNRWSNATDIKWTERTKKFKAGNGSCEDCCKGSEDESLAQLSSFILGQNSEPCHLVISCCRPSVCLVGRYLKFSRNVSQTRWMIDDERVGEASVEEIIGSNILPVYRGDTYKFHAAGREDIDVRMLGSGRPFLIEVQNPRQIPASYSVKEIEAKINNVTNKLIGVKNLRVASNEGWTLMKEGETEKQKQYCALVWISRALEEKDIELLASFKDMQISQKTPVRVLHRRSPLARDKSIHWMKVEKLPESRQYFLLHLCTQAGTYIKEFVHGDLGRTNPSIGSILGCRAEILQLDVTDVKMDGFESE